MTAAPLPALIEHFTSLEEPRMAGKCQHKLIDMVVIAVSGIICNADDWVTIAQGCSFFRTTTFSSIYNALG